MSTTKLMVPEATTGSFECRLRNPKQLQYFDTSTGTMTWLSTSVDSYNIPLTINAQGRGYAADVPANLPDGHYIQENYNSADPAFTAGAYEDVEVYVVSGERVTDMEYIVSLSASTADILVDTGTTIPSSLTTIDGIVDDILVDTGTTIPAAFALIASYGASSKTYTVTDGTNPIEGVSVRMTTDSAGSNTVARGTTDSSGEVTFYHNLASSTSVYMWRQLSGYTFTNPDTEVIP